MGRALGVLARCDRGGKIIIQGLAGAVGGFIPASAAISDLGGAHESDRAPFQHFPPDIAVIRVGIAARVRENNGRIAVIQRRAVRGADKSRRADSVDMA